MVSKGIYSDDHKKLITKLIEARVAANLRQADAAKLINKTQSYISKIEIGQKRIDLTEIKQLAKIYNKDIHSLID